MPVSSSFNAPPGVFIALFVLLAAPACETSRVGASNAVKSDEGGKTRPEPPTDPARRERLRDRARLVLEEYCGECHISSYDSSIPAAVAVFDLGETEWSRNMSADQLRDMKQRLDDPTVPSRGPGGRENDMTDQQRRAVERYVEMELRRRRAE